MLVGRTNALLVACPRDSARICSKREDEDWRSLFSFIGPEVKVGRVPVNAASFFAAGAGAGGG